MAFRWLYTTNKCLHPHNPHSTLRTCVQGLLWYHPKMFNHSGSPRALLYYNDANNWQQIYPYIGQADWNFLTAGPELRTQRDERQGSPYVRGSPHRLEQAALFFDFRAIIISSAKWQLRAQLLQHWFWNQITRKVKIINICFRKRENTRQNL